MYVNEYKYVANVNLISIRVIFVFIKVDGRIGVRCSY